MFGPTAKLIDEGRIGLGKLHLGGMAPKSLEIVKFPDRLIKDMDDDIGEIHQDPLTSADALGGQGANPHFTEVLFNPLRNALDLSIGTTGADDKIVGDGSDLANLH